MQLVPLQGTPYEMGRQHGEQFRDGARTMFEMRIALCLKQTREASRARLLELAAESLPLFKDYAPHVYAEFRGIAEGAGLSERELYIANGYTDFVDLAKRRYGAVSECTSLAVAPKAAADGKLYMGQTWDMHASVMPHIVALHRKPADGPATIALTTAGCLALIGINEAGIGIGNTNLAPIDAKPGVMYLALIHNALAQDTFDAAVAAVTRAPRMSGHHYYLGGPAGEFTAVETSAARHAALTPDELGVYAHANHYDHRILARELVAERTPNSVARSSQMWRLLSREAGRLGPDSLAQLLCDHEAPICRHTDLPDEPRTCAAALMCPPDRKIWLLHGNPCEQQMQAFTL
ncbi:MAG: hypothetical protein JXR37_01225 [Kiritimatiellae bacterium]|nr:hypothetical protein [Kiritimatiellia bacterium]